MEDFTINHKAYLRMLTNICLKPDIDDFFEDFVRQDCLDAMVLLRQQYQIYAMSHELQAMWYVYSCEMSTEWIETVRGQSIVGLVVSLVKLYGQEDSEDVTNEHVAIMTAMKG